MIKEIFHLLDNDLYKFTMQQLVLALYPEAIAEYRFINRGKQRFNKEFLKELNNAIDKLCENDYSSIYREQFYKLSFIQPSYIEFVKNFKFNKNEIKELDLTDDGDLNLIIKGPWRSAIMWEVKLMSIISELYYTVIDNSWSYDLQVAKATEKMEKLDKAGCTYADFGTRRRRSFTAQEMVVKTLKQGKGFVGTSNVLLAFEHGVKPIGTMAHELIQAISALESINHANRFMLEKWSEVYRGDLGIALTDTFGTDAFFKDFTKTYAKLFDGIRQDSGNPYKFTDKTIAHYKGLLINPLDKSIVFSDGLSTDAAIDIKKYCDKAGIKCSFGIGTHFTNDFSTPPLNMVIKLWGINNIPVIKVSDEPSKACGELWMINVVEQIYGLS